ncbi:MAG: hypothetical protein U5M50_08580 [Sphingobium sp.]|nr:hypothetical protein [Sphingobium sp.]
MNMKTSLIITGDSETAQAAVDDLKKSVDNLDATNAKAKSGAGQLSGAVGQIDRSARSSASSAAALSGALRNTELSSRGAALGQTALAAASGASTVALDALGVSAFTVEAILTGGLSIALTAAIGFLGGFAQGLFDGSSASNDQEKAAASLTVQLKELNAALDKETKSHFAAQVAALGHAESLRDLAVQAVETRKRLLETAIIAQRNADDPALASNDQQRAFLVDNQNAADQKVAVLQAELDAAKRDLADAQRAVRTARRPFVDRGIAAATDPKARENNGYDLKVAQLNLRRDSMSENEYARQRIALDRAHAAALDALDVSQKRSTQSARAHSAAQRQSANTNRAAAAELRDAFEDYVTQQQGALEVGRLLIEGRQVEASALRDVISLERQRGPLTEDQRATVLDLARQETAINDALEKRRELIGNYSQALSQIRGDLTSLLSGQSSIGDFFASYKKTFQQLQGKLLAENLFGDAFRQLQDFVEGRTGVTAAVDVMSSEAARAGSSAGRLADALDAAAGRVVGASPAGGGTISPELQAGLSTPIAFNWLNADGSAQLPDTEGKPITVEGINPNGVTKLTAMEYLQRTNTKLAENLTGALDRQLGTKFFSENLAKPISGALTGAITAGPVGAALGAIKDLKGLPEGVKTSLSKGFEGAQTGTTVAGIGKALGIKMSSTGSQLGGAIGSALPIPGGQIIGSIIGGLAGGLFGSTPKGSATITGSGQKDVAITGSEKYRTTLGAAADTIQGNLDRIAQALGGDASGAFAVSIGIRDGKYRVDPTGAGRTKKGNGVVDFGKDGAEAAVAAATADAIADGAIEGLSRAVQQAIKGSPNLDKSIAEALKVQDVELLLGGIGAVMEKQFRDQERQAKERVRIAAQYGFDVVAIEKKNAEERAALAEKLAQSQVGSLQNLVDELTRGSLFEGSGADQRTALLGAIDTAKADLAAGKDGAGDKLADLLTQLNSVSKDYYGSTGQFAADRSMILDQARSAIADSNARIAAAQAGSTSDPALATTNQALDENNDQNAQMLTKQDEIIALLQRFGGGGGGVPPASGGSSIGFSELFNMARTK